MLAKTLQGESGFQNQCLEIYSNLFHSKIRICVFTAISHGNTLDFA